MWWLELWETVFSKENRLMDWCQSQTPLTNIFTTTQTLANPTAASTALLLVPVSARPIYVYPPPTPQALFSFVFGLWLMWFEHFFFFLIFLKIVLEYSWFLAWKIPWTEEPGRLQSMGSLRVGHDWATSLSLFTFMHWRRKWQPTPVFLLGESQGQRSLVGCRLWGRTESDTTEVT